MKSIKHLMAAAAICMPAAMMAAGSAGTMVEDAFFDYTTTQWNGWHSETGTYSWDNAAVIENTEAAPNFWDVQYHIASGMSLTAGKTYVVELDLEGTAEGGNPLLALGDWGKRSDTRFTLPASREKVSVTLVCPEEAASNQFLLMQSGDYVGTIRIYSVRVSHEDKDINPDLLCLEASNLTVKENAWEQQVVYTLPTALEQGKSYVLSADVMGDAPGSVGIWGSGSGSTQYGIPGLSVGNGRWRSQTISFQAEFPHTQLEFCFGTYAGTVLRFDNFSLKELGSDTELIENGDFSEGHMHGWSKPSWHSHNVMLVEYEQEALPPSDTPMAPVKPLTYHNPISAITLCADPTAVEYEGRLYVYGTCDQQQYDLSDEGDENNYGKIRKLSVFSTADMVNWTHHGEIDMARVCGTWMAASWAPSIVSRVESDGLTHFYLYFSNSGGGVGVITSTSPTGPWTSPLDHTFVSAETAPELAGCSWLFDPGVVIDDEGNGWLAFAGGDPKKEGGSALMPGNVHIVKLGADMISFASDFVQVPAPYHLEANELNIIGGKFVLSYSSSWQARDNWSEYSSEEAPGSCSICYVTSDNPLDRNSWQWGGELLKNPGTFGFPWGNNHTHLHKFNDAYYIIHHTQVMDQLAGITGGYRSMAIDLADVDEATCKITGKASNEGVDMIEGRQPKAAEVQQAETMFNAAGVRVAALEGGNAVVNDITPGGWVCVENVDFGETPLDTFIPGIEGEGIMDVYLDDLSSAPVATLEFSTKGRAASTAKLTSGVTGTHRVFFAFKSADPTTKFDTWQFAASGSTGIENVAVEDDKAPVEYFSISGMRMNSGNPAPGIYIRRQGSKVEKVLIK